MKHKYSKFYETYSVKALFVFMWDLLLTKERAKKVSLMNRLRDYRRLANDQSLFKLHQEINRILFFSSEEWQSHDYGEGYFYQGFTKVGIRGLRDTTARVREMELEKITEGKSVIDIGCNSGFLALSLAKGAKHIIGMDIHPDLISVGNLVAHYLGNKNVQLFVSTFEDFVVRENVDVILSCANHSTFDGNTKQSLEEYFDKCKSLLKPGGLLIFESHHPQYEGGDALERVCQIIGERFKIQTRQILKQGTFFDQGRTFLVANVR